MTTPTDKLIEDLRALVPRRPWLPSDKLILRAADHIEHQAAALVAAEDEIGRLRRMLSMFVDAAKPRRMDGYHEMPMFSAKEIALARAELQHPQETE